MYRPPPTSNDDTITLQYSGTEPGVQAVDVTSDIVEHWERRHQVQEGGGRAGMIQTL